MRSSVRLATPASGKLLLSQTHINTPPGKALSQFCQNRIIRLQRINLHSIHLSKSTYIAIDGE